MDDGSNTTPSLFNQQNLRRPLPPSLLRARERALADTALHRAREATRVETARRRHEVLARHELVQKLADLDLRQFNSVIELATEFRHIRYPEERRSRKPSQPPSPPPAPKYNSRNWSDADWFSC